MPRSIRFSVLVLLGLLALFFLGPYLFWEGAAEPSMMPFAAPCWQHWCGTDLNGRDLFYRILAGGRISFLVGGAGAFITLVIGTSYGMIAGYFGGWCDAGMMRCVDILYSIPRLIFVLIFINAFNDHFQHLANSYGCLWVVASSRIFILVMSLGLIEWLTMARLVRGQTLSLKERSFIAAAQVLGQKPLGILWRHIFPNLLGMLIVVLTLSIPAVIIDEAFLSFLGLGVQAPMASLGSLLAEGAAAINPLKIAWWTLLFPALFLLLLLITLNKLGNQLREASLKKK